MSDKPLFQHMDEQEDKNAAGDPDDTAMGNAALGLSAGNSAGGMGASQSTPGVGAGPAIGAAAIGEVLRGDDDERPRD